MDGVLETEGVEIEGGVRIGGCGAGGGAGAREARTGRGGAWGVYARGPSEGLRCDGH